MYRLVVLFAGCLGVAWLVCLWFGLCRCFVVLGDAGPLLLSPCNTSDNRDRLNSESQRLVLVQAAVTTQLCHHTCHLPQRQRTGNQTLHVAVRWHVLPITHSQAVPMAFPGNTAAVPWRRQHFQA